MGLKLHPMGRFLVKTILVLGQPPGRRGKKKFSWLERDIFKEIFKWPEPFLDLHCCNFKHIPYFWCAWSKNGCHKIFGNFYLVKLFQYDLTCEGAKVGLGPHRFWKTFFPLKDLSTSYGTKLFGRSKASIIKQNNSFLGSKTIIYYKYLTQLWNDLN